MEIYSLALALATSSRPIVLGFVDVLRAAVTRAIRARCLRAAPRELGALDNHTPQDLGFSGSQLDSVAADLGGGMPATHRQVLQSSAPRAAT